MTEENRDIRLQDNGAQVMIAVNGEMPDDEYAFLMNQMRMIVSVSNFHRRFSLKRRTMSPEGTLEYLRTRLVSICEELGEMASEMNDGQPVDALVELADLHYLISGMLHTLGDFGDEAAMVVVRSNDAKTPEDYNVDEITGKLVREE